MTFAVRCPFAAFCICLILTLLAAAGLPKLKFDDGSKSAFRSSYPATEIFDEFERLFSGSGADIAIHLASEDFADPERFRAVHDFVLETGLLEPIADRMSVFGLPKKPDHSGHVQSLFSDDEGGIETNRNALQQAASHPLNGGRLITANLKHLLIAVRLKEDDQNAVAAALDEIEDLAESSLSGVGVTHALVGIPVLRARVIEDIVQDQRVMNVAGALIGLGLCLVLFRRPMPALNAGLPAVIALVWVLGFLGHSGIGINTLTNTLPVLIMVLAFADSMHLTYEKLAGEAEGLETRAAVSTALERAGPACFMTSLTTALAFAALLISGSELVWSLAIAGLVAVAFTFVAVILLNPLIALAAIRIFGQHPPRAHKIQPLLFPRALWAGMLDKVLQRPKVVCLAGIAALLIAVTLHSQIEPRFSILENVNAQAPELERHTTVESLFAPLSTLDVMVSVPRGPEPFSAPTLLRLGLLHEALEQRFGQHRVVSVWNAARWLDEKTPSETGSLIAGLVDAGGRSNLFRFVSEDSGSYRIAVLTPELDSPDALRLAQDVEHVVSSVTTSWPEKPQISGLLQMSAVVSTKMINELNYSFLAAAALSGIILGLWCQRIWVAFVALFVNVLPITLAGAWLTASGHDLQFASGLALTIAFGIAVDDTIHVLNQLRPKLITGTPLGVDDLRMAFTRITPVLLATTVILVGGIGSALLSAIPTINLFAGISMMVLVAALVSDVVILPAMLSFLIRHSKGRIRI